MSVVAISAIKADIRAYGAALTTDIAKRLPLYGVGQDLLADAFSRALISAGVQIWITDTVLSRRRPGRAHIVPVAPLLVPVLTGHVDRGGCDARNDDPKVC